MAESSDNGQRSATSRAFATIRLQFRCCGRSCRLASELRLLPRSRLPAYRLSDRRWLASEQGYARSSRIGTASERVDAVSSHANLQSPPPVASNFASADLLQLRLCRSPPASPLPIASSFASAGRLQLRLRRSPPASPPPVASTSVERDQRYDMVRWDLGMGKLCHI
nr:hypothetical protein Iba_chr12bCG16250 [Ipomoea batatas]